MTGNSNEQAAHGSTNTWKAASSRRSISSSLAALSIAMAWPANAFAQGAGAVVGTAAGQPPAAEVAKADLGDIVVTARRVSERLQDIPASVAAVSGAQVQRFTSLDSLSNVVSGVTFKSFGPIPAVGIRGFGNRQNTQGPNGTVGIFQDGVFIAPFLNALTSRIDVARIEVAKGPQSTLYGRSSYAGAINIVTNEPTRVLSGYIDAGIGGSAAHGEMLGHLRGVVSGPLTDTLSARIFLLREKREGITYDPVTGNRGYGYNRSAGRIKLKWAPADALTVSLAGTFMHDNSPRGDVHTDRYALPPLGGRTLFGNPFIVPVFPSGPDIWRTNLTREQLGKVNGRQATLDVRYKLGLGELAFLSDYTHSDTYIQSSGDPSTRNINDTYTITKEKRFSQEVRLRGKADRLSYLVGLYYLFVDFNTGRSGDTLDLSAPFARAYPGSVLYDLNGIKAIYAPAQTTTRAYAGFAQLGYDLTDKLNLTVGLRHTTDKLSGVTRSSNLLVSGVVVTPVPQAYRKVSFDATTGSANLSYQVVPGTLVYASYAKGDSPGGFNNGAAAKLNYSPQKVDSYEVGLKTELFDRRARFNVALFKNDYQDIQFFQVFSINNIATQVTTNAAKARGEGVDVDATIAFSQHLKANVQYTYQTSKITGYVTPPLPAPQVDYTGVSLVRSPKHSLNGSLSFVHEIGRGKFQMTAEGSYTSSYNNDYTGVPAGTPYPGRPGVPPGVTTKQVLGLYRTPGYAVANLNASYELGHVEYGFYVRNLFNRQYIAAAATTDAFTYPLAVPGEPRTFELSAKWTF